MSKQYFNENFHCLSNIKLKGDGGEELLNKIILQRIDASLLDEGARKDLIAASGGLIRSLIALMRNAVVSAVGRNAKRIEKGDVDRAVTRLRGDFIAMLEDKYYPTLKARSKDKRLSSDQEIQELLESLALLEYENGAYWCDVHPIVLPVVEERTK